MKFLDQPPAAVPHVVLFCCQLMFAVMQGTPAELQVNCLVKLPVAFTTACSEHVTPRSIQTSESVVSITYLVSGCVQYQPKPHLTTFLHSRLQPSVSLLQFLSFGASQSSLSRAEYLARCGTVLQLAASE